MREAFALQKLLTFFNKKYWSISDINIRNFNETLTNSVVSFEHLGPVVQSIVSLTSSLRGQLAKGFTTL